MLATLREDWAEAVRRWTALRERFPDEVRGYAEGAKALLRSGQVAAAEAVLQDAMARFADEPSLLVQHAEVAQARQDWTLAASRWEAALARDPDNQVTGHKLAVARMRVAETASAGAPNAAPVRFEGADPAVPEAERSAMLDLMMGFESLGSVRVGCEFGGVQRRFGAEPLGLLRWAEIHPDKLIDALSVEFEGVGLGANTIMYPFDDKPDAEYLTADTRFGLVSHTFASVAEHDREQFYKGVCQRLVFLRRKLLDDLAEARKIFVYKIDGVDMPDAEVTRLHAALCRFGRNTLLCVRLAQPNNPDGLVERIAPRLYIGYVGRFANGPEQPLPSWLAICRTAARMRQEDTA
jgi:tetratricopeptide (TPR) repeat protein